MKILYLLSEGYVGLLEGLRQQHGLLVVDVVVGIAVDQEELFVSEQLHSSRDICPVVTSQIIFIGRQTHIPLGVDRICKSTTIDVDHTAEVVP